jgi:hypothetical protein
VNASASPSFNELHQATTDGSFVFGRNDQVISVPAVTTSNPFFSGAIGQAALAHMYGSLAHSSLQRVNRGDSQYVRVNLKELYIGNDAELRLGNGVKPTLPYTNGNAIVKVQFVGSGAGADCKKVGSTYTVSNPVPNDNNVLNVVATPKEVSTALDSPFF